MIDTHIHLSHFTFEQTFPYLSLEKDGYSIQSGTREEIIGRFQEAGIRACIDPAIEISSNPRLLALSEQYPSFIFPAVGVHPTRTFRYRTTDPRGKMMEARLRFQQRRELEAFADHPQVVAIGETGLDYHLPRKEQHRFRQKRWFVWQIQLAHRRHLPLVLHIRDAHRDAIRILTRYRKCLHGGVAHCFNAGPAEAAQYVQLGLMLGIGGSLLMQFPGIAALQEAVRQTPLDHLLLETDGPYVRPYIPTLGKKQIRKARNTSLILPAVVQRISEIKNISPAEVERVTTENAIRLFGLPADLRH